MSNPSLADVQRWMKTQILPGDHTPHPSTVVLNPQRAVPGQERLAVYAGGYLARMREALAEVYEAVHHILGEERFTELSHAYAHAHPSHDYNLSFAGRHFSTFLTAAAVATELPFLPDLARLEWMVCIAFHAFEQPPVDPSRLSSLPLDAWERARLVFQPSVSVVTSAWPILDLWQARAQPRETIDIALVDRPQHVFVFRRALQVHCELIDERQALLLQSLLDGAALGDACNLLTDSANQVETLPVTEWFARWTRAGLLVACEVEQAQES